MELISRITWGDVRSITPTEAAKRWAAESWDEPREITQIELVPGPLAIEFRLKNGLASYRCAYVDGAYQIERLG